jgi:hypothetical protein
VRSARARGLRLGREARTAERRIVGNRSPHRLVGERTTGQDVAAREREQKAVDGAEIPILGAETAGAERRQVDLALDATRRSRSSK